MINQFHTDKPAFLQSEDRFQRYEFSKRLASIVAEPNIDKSLIIGLYGKWGEGKTTVMNFVQQELPLGTVVVNFNPWLFSDEQQLLRSFFSMLANSLGTEIKSNKEKFGKILADYGDAIGDATEYIPKVGSKFKWLGKLGEKLNTISIDKLKSRIDNIIRESGKSIVIFVDDIDRLDIQEIQYVFKLVKLVGDFPRTAYILSFDDEMVSAALAPKYGGDTKAAGYNFLEKIIQLPLKIPKANKKALYKYTTDLLYNVLNNALVELSKNENSDFTEAFNTAFLPFMENPRLGIRYANAFAFSLPMLKGEVNTSNLLVVEGIKIFYPELYDFIRDNSHIFLQKEGDAKYKNDQEEKNLTRKKISNILDVYTVEKQTAIIEMLQQLFPQLKNVYSNTSFPDNIYIRWMKEKKICSGKYFDRYFSFTIEEGDIPDNYFDQLLKDLQNNSIEDLVVKFTQAIEQYDSFWIIQKLKMRVADLDELQSQNLALVIASIGHTLPIENDIHFATTYAQSARLITGIIESLPKNKRLPSTLKLLPETQSLEYAMEIVHYLCEKKDFDEDILREQDKVPIQEYLVTRFQKEVTDETFFSMLSDGNLWDILIWWSKMDDQKYTLKIFLNKHLDRKDNPEFALNLLKVFTPTITSNSYNPNDKSIQMSTYKSGFYESNYNSIKEVVDVRLLNDNLISTYGMNPYEKEPLTISDRDPINDKTLISVFQWFIENS